MNAEAPGRRNPDRFVVVHPDATVLAEAVASRLVTRLLDAQSVRRPVHVLLTGGTVGIASLAALGHHPARDAVDWSGVHLWWGDERFLADGDPDRNETQARAALLDHLDRLPATNVHPMLGADAVASPEESAARYAAELRRYADAGTGPSGEVPGADGDTGPDGETPGPGGEAPAFDVALFGMGPDGHVASLFPGFPQIDAAGAPTAGVHRSPKPPPERVTLTFPAIRGSREVWVVAAGAEKADAVARALAGDDVHSTPAAGAVGTGRTLWLIDAGAAGG